MRRTAGSSAARKMCVSDRSHADRFVTAWDRPGGAGDGEWTAPATTVLSIGPLLFVLGTHNAATAWAAARGFHEDTVGPVPFGLKSRLADSARQWVHPDVPGHPDRIWPAHLVSNQPKPGWLPFFVARL